MRIIIDMQGAQTESRFRGIGRYTMSLAQAIVRNRGKHQIILALSGLFPDTIEPIRAAFDGLLPQENIRIWYSIGPMREYEADSTWRREVSELAREAFLASFNPDMIFVTSLFEGYVDDAVTSIGRFESTIPVAVMLYDLIPLLNPDHYLKPNPRFEQYYFRKIGHLGRASLLLTISESSRQEGFQQLGFDMQIVNISCAVDAVFRPLTMTEDQTRTLYAQFGLSRPFVLYSGGADERKNLLRLIKAYGLLSPVLRQAHQLVFAGKMPENEIQRLKAEARSVGLRTGELRCIGYVSDDELTQLYSLCRLFVFPSWHEGFGLPALEAMACGAPVIGANTSSVPEVIGRSDALFDPHDTQAISLKMAEVLEDAALRVDLATHGLKQAKRFSWDESARCAIHAFETYSTQHRPLLQRNGYSVRRPSLAYVSPLPPERTGIADYSAELLPALSRHYDIEVVVAQTKVNDPWIQANCPIRDPQWLRDNAHRMDRVLYQLGNSPFHQYILDLLADIPGTVVLHDFFLGNLPFCLEEYGSVSNAWTQALYHCHGYAAVREHYQDLHSGRTKLKYPVNLEILQHAQGVIVHSAYSLTLAKEWLGESFSDRWRVIPLLRAPYVASDRNRARSILGLKPDDFVLCSFGFLDPTKYNYRLLQAFLQSRLAQDSSCQLVFVGENHGGEYGRQLLEAIRSSGLTERIRITGWADHILFRNYLAAADLAIQLRTQSRGETSAAMLDCLNHATPTIVNANGSFAELPLDTVWMLPEEFSDMQLIEALETLWQDEARRNTMGKRARQMMLTHHAPATCAEQYADAIEYFHTQAQTGLHVLLRAVAATGHTDLGVSDMASLAQAIAQSFPAKRSQRQLLIDISGTSQSDLKTGIERVAHGLIVALLNSPPVGYRIEPVYLSNEEGVWHYRFARRYTLGLLGCPQDILTDEIVEVQNGDILLGVDLSGHRLIEAHASGLYDHLRNIGVFTYFIVFDLLPVQMPEVFPPGADRAHAQWLQVITELDGAICISKAVADAFFMWLSDTKLNRHAGRPFRVGWFHLGADVANAVPTQGLPNDAEWMLRQFRSRPTFLMVGTIEPRKGYLQVLEAFTQMWQDGREVNLVIVGKEGWKVLPENMRRTIPRIVQRIKAHSELGRRLFWLEGISDEYLEWVYTVSTCLIAASEGEGFGLPLIEAAQHKLPIIARDIPVFREIVGEHAFYFNGSEPSILRDAITQWLELHLKHENPSSENLFWSTWSDSVQQLLSNILGSNWLKQYIPSSHIKSLQQHI